MGNEEIRFMGAEMQAAMAETFDQNLKSATAVAYTPQIQQDDTPFIDHDTPDPDRVQPTGLMSKVAASVLMKTPLLDTHVSIRPT